jgi:L-alanine-DL-glutamate epimerase-like enolase superfamily enzyme
MKITAVDPIIVRIPFEDGGAGVGIGPQRWHMLDIVLVKISTDAGLTGWGEAFGYFCYRAVAAAVTDLIAPLVVGRDLETLDVAALNLEIQKRMTLFGRYGVTIFALSGVDIALWDLKAKIAGVDVATLIAGTRKREEIPAYASLVRYGDAALVARFSEQAAKQGYATLKLHEITMPEIRAGRAAIDRTMKFTIDVNNNWSEANTLEVLPELKALETYWLEEPVFPPEDWATLVKLGTHGVAIAAGENACTSVEFSHLIPAVTYSQPSVTKIGGISEFLRATDLARAHGRVPMPHSPYFGPGYQATLQLAAAVEDITLFEYLWIEPKAWLVRDMPLPEKGCVAVPKQPGIGFTPDMGVVERYRTR